MYHFLTIKENIDKSKIFCNDLSAQIIFNFDS